MGIAHPGHQHPVGTIDYQSVRVLRDGRCLDGSYLRALDQDVTREMVIGQSVEDA